MTKEVESIVNEFSSFLEAREKWMWSEKAIRDSEKESEPRCYRHGGCCGSCDDYYTCPALKV